MRTQLRHADYWRAYWVKTPSATLAPTPTGGTGGNVTRNSTYKTDTLQSDFNHRFLALGMRHEGSYPAERSKVMELGAKWLLREGDLALRAALYRADKDWERNTPNFTFNMWSRYNLGGG